MPFSFIKNTFFTLIVLGIFGCTTPSNQDDIYMPNPSSREKQQAELNENERRKQEFINFQKQQAEAKRKREGKGLKNDGSIDSEDENSKISSIGSNVFNPSMPAYTYMRVVPANQSCPEQSTKLVKREIVRGNKLCFYE